MKRQTTTDGLMIKSKNNFLENFPVLYLCKKLENNFPDKTCCMGSIRIPLEALVFDFNLSIVFFGNNKHALKRLLGIF